MHNCGWGGWRGVGTGDGDDEHVNTHIVFHTQLTLYRTLMNIYIAFHTSNANGGDFVMVCGLGVAGTGSSI